MQSTILHITQVPAHLRRDYNGRKFEAVTCETLIISAEAGLWSGGSRDSYSCVRLSDGESMDMPNESAAPWDSTRRNRVVPVAPGFAIVRHSVFCGRDSGLVFYVNPADVAALLPAPDASELSRAEMIVLSVTSNYISRVRREYAAANGVDALGFADSQVSLRNKGLMSGNGGLTVKGKNAAANLPAEMQRLSLYVA